MPLRWLRRAVDEREPLVLLVRLLPFAEPLRADPRFADVVKGVWG
jgi:hypothetical protein